jgi:spore germination protein YaaH
MLFLFSCSGGGGGSANDPTSSGPPATAGDTTSPSNLSSGLHRRCGWVADDRGTAAFVDNAEWFDAVHPYWYALGSDGISVTTMYTPDDPKLLGAATLHRVAVMPLVTGVGDPSLVRSMLNDPTRRSAHIGTLVQLAVEKGYAGLDIDYEGLWDASDRPGFTAFIQELAVEMHAAKKQLSLAVPALDGTTDKHAWSYPELAAAADHLHLMGYDFHNINTHAGPTAPIGWIDAVMKQVDAAGHPEKFILGIPNYGIGNGFFEALGDAPGKCTSPAENGADHMASCSLGSYNAGTVMRCPTANGELYFDTLASLEEKVNLAATHKLGGITYWMAGGELPGFFDMIRKHF